MKGAIRIHPCDNVAVSLEPVAAGDILLEVPAAEAIPAGHKMALTPIRKGELVVKYGFPIGEASCDILPGQWVHSHNLATRLKGAEEYEYTPGWKSLTPREKRIFWGYRREDGQVGIRNEVWIIPTVGCVNPIAKELEGRGRALAPDGLDGVHAFAHPHGCSQMGEDHRNTQRALAGLVRHPNAGAVLVLGLGCENNHMEEFRKELGECPIGRVQFLNCQDCGDEIARGTELLQELCAYAAGFQREECPAAELVIGTKCGGSDGFSGITANPLIGTLTGEVTSRGGKVLLTEVPEMFGAETLLMNRCVDKELFGRTVTLVNSFKEYFLRYGQPVGENPSPGNREGGITTLEEKSLGCVQKGADAPVTGVLDYGEPAVNPGLNLLQAPGNDLISTAALAVSGAQLVLFSTGRGTPFACPVPTVKISSNSALADRKPHWIDFDAGRLLEGKPMETLGQELLDLVLDLASGQVRAKSEGLDKGELAIFKDGVTL